ncbi:MAG: TlpA family protein disulfide reductase [Oscillospiraceae bacterium]|nr:TlpA family protein disulfide reductase [Oscillospiraceae bacterium]
MTKKQIIPILLLLGLLILLGGAYLLYGSLTAEPSPPTITAPTITTPDFAAEDQAGIPVFLSDFLGDRPTVVYFWTSWCTWCTQGMEELESFYQQVGDQFQILAVNLTQLGQRRGELDAARAFMEEDRFTFPSLYDIYGDAQSAYAVRGVPMALFIDSDGALAHSQLGFMTVSQLWEVAQLLS